MDLLYSDVPKEYLANLRYREELRLKARNDAGLRSAIMAASKHDVLWFFNAMCLAAGTPVVTDRGLIPIESVKSSDLVWDGDNWVSQGGAIFRGHKEVIDAYGIYLTHDHKVWTKHGWKPASKRHDRAEIRLPYGHSSRRKDTKRSRLALSVRLRELENSSWEFLEKKANKKLRVLEGRRSYSRLFWDTDLQRLARNDLPVLQKTQQVIPSLWRSRHFGLRPMAYIRELPCRHGIKTRWQNFGEKGQRWKLLSRKLSVGDIQGAVQQYQKEQIHRNLLRSHDNSSGGKGGWCFSGCDSVSRKQRGNRKAAVREKDSTKLPKKPVYDLINCGHKRAFTVIDRSGRPLLVHNCWLYEPRPGIDPETGREKPKVFPFITWPHQDPVIVETREKLGFEDVGWNKTRGEGASWIACGFTVQDHITDPMSAIGLVSRNQDMADNTEDPDSLFWKIDWLLSMLPWWMVGDRDIDWKRDVSKHTRRNLRNGATIAAYAAVQDVGSGGRKKYFLMDELSKFPKPADADAMASTQAVTHSRLVVSTFKGAYGAYYDLMTKESSLAKYVLDWRDNPTKNRGLYHMLAGKPVAVDPENNPLPPEYDPPNEDIVLLLARLRRNGFNLEKSTRSPWYDRECDRAGATPENIAEELDRDPGGSMAKAFGDGFFREANLTTRGPSLRGEFTFDPATLDDGPLKSVFDTKDDGDMLLWCRLDKDGKPPKGRYVVSCDICYGMGGDFTSNSVLQVIDLKTGEQVAEFANNSIEPAQFADFAMAVSYWFHTAFLAWEINGPGGGFTTRVLLRRYPDTFERPVLWKKNAGRKNDRDLGWYSSTESKRAMFIDFNMAVIERQIVIRSFALKDECHQYIREKGKYEHNHNITGDSSHGDRVIAMAIGWQAAKERPQPKVGEEDHDPSNPPPNTLAARQKLWREQASVDFEDREREPGELMGTAYGGDFGQRYYP